MNIKKQKLKDNFLLLTSQKKLKNTDLSTSSSF